MRRYRPMGPEPGSPFDAVAVQEAPGVEKQALALLPLRGQSGRGSSLEEQGGRLEGGADSAEPAAELATQIDQPHVQPRRGLHEHGPRITHRVPSPRAIASDRTKSVSMAMASRSEGPAVLSTTTWSRRYSARISSMGRWRVRVARMVASMTALRARL